MRVSKADGSQVLDLQRDALLAAGVSERHLYSDTASGKKDDRPGLAACLQALREGDTLVVWKLDRLGRSLRHLVNVVHDLTSRGIGLRVLTGQGAAIDTTTPAGKLVFGIFASLAEFERDLISERTRAGLASARARGRKGGRRPKMTPAKLRLAMAAMGKPETNVGDSVPRAGHYSIHALSTCLAYWRASWRWNATSQDGLIRYWGGSCRLLATRLSEESSWYRITNFQRKKKFEITGAGVASTPARRRRRITGPGALSQQDIRANTHRT